MRRATVLGTVALALAAFGGPAARACSVCKQTPCTQPVAPAMKCVTEMVPYTVMKQQTRFEMVPVTKTITVNEPETTFIWRERMVCRPVFETSYVPVKHTAWKAVYDTTTRIETFTVCRPVSTVETVTETCLQPTTRYVSAPVPVKSCGLGLLCGKHHHAPCGGLTTTCQTVAQTVLVPVPVTRQVVHTRMVSEVQTREVPVTHCRMVPEERTEQMPVTNVRTVQEKISERVPVFGSRCVTKTVTCMVPRPITETVPVTCYRPVKHWVPCEPPVAPLPVAAPAPTLQQGPVLAPSSQGILAPTGQGPH